MRGNVCGNAVSTGAGGVCLPGDGAQPTTASTTEDGSPSLSSPACAEKPDADDRTTPRDIAADTTLLHVLRVLSREYAKAIDERLLSHLIPSFPKESM